MFCPNCQTQNPDGMGFCGRCGTPLAAPAAPAAPAYQPPVTPQPVPANPAVAAVKKLCASPLTLIAVIAFTASIFLELVNIITLLEGGFDGLIYGVALLFSELGIESAGIVNMLRNVLYDVQDMILPICLIGCIPTIFVIIGLWVSYTSNLNRQSPLGRTGGLSLIKAGVIIEMIALCTGMGIGSFLTIGGGISLMNSYYSQDEAPFLIGIGFGLLIGLAFAIVFYVLILKSLKAAKVALKTGKVVKKASAFVAVMCFISAASNLMSLLESAGDMEVIGLLTSVCSSLAAVLFGVIIFLYRSKTSPYRVAFAKPAYPQQPVYPQPAYQPPYQQPAYQQPAYAQPTYQPPVAPPVYQPAPQPVAVAAPVAEPVYQPAPASVEPVVEPVVEVAPVVEPVVEATPVEEPVVEVALVEEPVVEVALVEEPVAEPVVEATPVVEPVVEPVEETVAAPVEEPVVEVAPVAEPVVEAAPVEEPVLAPAEEPILPPVVEVAPAPQPVVPPVVVPPAPQPVAAPTRVFCTQCGQPLTTDQRFCPNCGTPNQ